MGNIPGNIPGYGEAFERLLAALAADREAAGLRYEDMRRRLRKFFAWRGAAFPDELADETMDRVGTRLASGQRIYADDPAAYVHGIARNVLRESWRRQSLARLDPAFDRAAPTLEETGLDEVERRSACLDCCLRRLAPARRRLALAYYGSPERRAEVRKALAAELGIDPSALRLRMHRLRARLGKCLQACLDGPETRPRPASGAAGPCVAAGGSRPSTWPAPDDRRW